MSEIDCVGGNDQVSICLNSEKNDQFDAIVDDDDESNAYMPDGLNLRGIYDANCNQINGAMKGDVSERRSAIGRSSRRRRPGSSMWPLR